MWFSFQASGSPPLTAYAINVPRTTAAATTVLQTSASSTLYREPILAAMFNVQASNIPVSVSTTSSQPLATSSRPSFAAVVSSLTGQNAPVSGAALQSSQPVRIQVVPHLLQSQAGSVASNQSAHCLQVPPEAHLSQRRPVSQQGTQPPPLQPPQAPTVPPMNISPENSQRPSSTQMHLVIQQHPQYRQPQSQFPQPQHLNFNPQLQQKPQHQPTKVCRTTAAPDIPVGTQRPLPNVEQRKSPQRHPPINNLQPKPASQLKLLPSPHGPINIRQPATDGGSQDLFVGIPQAIAVHTSIPVASSSQAAHMATIRPTTAVTTGQAIQPQLQIQQTSADPPPPPPPPQQPQTPQPLQSTSAAEQQQPLQRSPQPSTSSSQPSQQRQVQKRRQNRGSGEGGVGGQQAFYSGMTESIIRQSSIHYSCKDCDETSNSLEQMVSHVMASTGNHRIATIFVAFVISQDETNRRSEQYCLGCKEPMLTTGCWRKHFASCSTLPVEVKCAYCEAVVSLFTYNFHIIRLHSDVVRTLPDIMNCVLLIRRQTAPVMPLYVSVFRWLGLYHAYVLISRAFLGLCVDPVEEVLVQAFHPCVFLYYCNSCENFFTRVRNSVKHSANCPRSVWPSDKRSHVWPMLFFASSESTLNCMVCTREISPLTRQGLLSHLPCFMMNLSFTCHFSCQVQPFRTILQLISHVVNTHPENALPGTRDFDHYDRRILFGYVNSPGLALSLCCSRSLLPDIAIEIYRSATALAQPAPSTSATTSGGGGGSSNATNAGQPAATPGAAVASSSGKDKPATKTT